VTKPVHRQPFENASCLQHSHLKNCRYFCMNFDSNQLTLHQGKPVNIDAHVLIYAIQLFILGPCQLFQNEVQHSEGMVLSGNLISQISSSWLFYLCQMRRGLSWICIF
jgi:hypothetical protein